MKTAILAGGLAKRLGSLTENRPKSLVTTADRPFIDSQMDLLSENGCKEVIFCIGHLGEKIRSYVGTGEKWGLEVGYSEDGPTPLGTGGALKKALHLLGNTFFVTYGDSYLREPWRNVRQSYERQEQPEGLMTVFPTSGQWGTNNVLLQNGKIQCYDKSGHTAEMAHIDYGLLILSRTAVQRIEKTQFDLEELQQDLIRRKTMGVHVCKERFYEVGSLQGIKELDILLKTSS